MFQQRKLMREKKTKKRGGPNAFEIFLKSDLIPMNLILKIAKKMRIEFFSFQLHSASCYCSSFYLIHYSENYFQFKSE